MQPNIFRVSVCVRGGGGGGGGGGVEGEGIFIIRNYAHIEMEASNPLKTIFL